jgi:hypothetical protein
VEVDEDSTWPSINELVNYALAPDDPADKEFSARLRRAHAADPDKGREIFLKLLRNPLSRVREFAVIAGSKFGGTELIVLLPELLDDPNKSVQELALQVLGDVAPDLLRTRVDVLRRKFKEWRGYDENDPIIHLAWIAVKLDIPELAPEIRRISEDETYDSGTRRQAAVRVAYLERGPAEILRRIEEHDHDNMLFLCRLAWMKDLKGARAAYEQCADRAPDEKCRKWCQRFAVKAAEAEAAGEPLSARPPPA